MNDRSAEFEVSQSTTNRVLHMILFALFVTGVIFVLSMELSGEFKVAGLALIFFGYVIAAALGNGD
jgi:hypothetical protein